MHKVFVCIGLVLSTMTVSVPAEAAWAVAVSKSGQAMIVSRWSMANQARSRVKRECHQRFGECEVIASWPGGCVAIASDMTVWAVAQKSHDAETEAEATDQCKAKGGKLCRIVLSHCGS